MKQINSFLSTLITAYNQQGQTGKILILGLSILLFCCLCSGPIALARSRNNSNPVPSPVIFPTQVVQATPTSLFNFGSPVPTLVVPSALPTTPAPATATLPPTPTVSTETATTIPSATATSIPTNTVVPPTATNAGSVSIIEVNKPTEYVDIQNLTGAAVDLSGWTLVSVTGNQTCKLRGSLQPNEVLRIWSRRGNPGLSCRFPINIWNDNQSDPAVLYNAQGQEVSRYP